MYASSLMAAHRRLVLLMPRSQFPLATLQSLDKTKSISAISDALSKSEYSPDTAGIPDVRHFLYKAKSVAQFTSSKLRRQPYAEEEAAWRLHETYLQLQNRMHSQQRPLKLMYLAGKYENVLCWVRSANFR